jgi:predicted kinase
MPSAFAFRGPMTAKKRFKRRVRDRARKTGESYTAALAHVRHRPEQEQSMSDQVSAAHNEPSSAASGPVIIVSGAGGVGKSTVSGLIAATFDPSVHLNTDDFMASVVGGWVDPNLPAAAPQNEAVGAAFAVSAMSFAESGYATVLDGYLFPDGVDGLTAAGAARGLTCHYAVLTADLETCWARASSRGEGRWQLEFEPFAAVHEKFEHLDLDARHLVEATGSPEHVRDAVLSAFRAGRLLVSNPDSAP